MITLNCTETQEERHRLVKLVCWTLRGSFVFQMLD